MIRASDPTRTSSIGALIAIRKVALPSDAGAALSDGCADLSGAAPRGRTIGASRTTGAATLSGAFSGTAFGSGCAWLSSISAGRDCPVLASGAFAIGVAGPSNPLCAYIFVLVHRSHQSPTVSYHSFEFCGFNTQCPSSGKYSILLGTFSRCSAVNSCNPSDTSSR